MVDTAPDFDPAVIQTWSPKAQQLAAKMLNDRINDPPKFWYCDRGRECDGMEHGKFNYRHARGDQWPPEGNDWYVWAMLSGRGAGKTRSGTEWVRKMSSHFPRIAAIAQTTRDVRAVMVEGDSGLISVCERAKVPYDWKPSIREFTFLDNGGKVLFYTGEEPDSLRGPQHHIAWLDEPAHMPLIDEVWMNLLMGLRLGRRNMVLVTTTPLPTPWMKTLAAKPSTRVVRVSTRKNLANLSQEFKDNVISQYEGTRIGRQELDGEIVDDVEGALWNTALIDGSRVMDPDVRLLIIQGEFEKIDFDRIVVGVDPAGTSTKRSDETGIVVVGRRKGLYYVLDDLSGQYTPDQWAKIAVRAYRKWNADRIVAEKNYGGDMVAANLRNQDESVPLTIVNSRRGKEIRAEPVVGLYEQGRVKHIQPFPTMETQMCEWVPGRGASPDRVDALVHAVTDLSKGAGQGSMAIPQRQSATTTSPANVFSPRRY